MWDWVLVSFTVLIGICVSIAFLLIVAGAYTKHLDLDHAMHLLRWPLVVAMGLTSILCALGTIWLLMFSEYGVLRRVVAAGCGLVGVFYFMDRAKTQYQIDRKSETDEDVS
jgi:amino acid transporter